MSRRGSLDGLGIGEEVLAVDFEGRIQRWTKKDHGKVREISTEKRFERERGEPNITKLWNPAYSHINYNHSTRIIFLVPTLLLTLAFVLTLLLTFSISDSTQGSRIS